ncbi:hypothetical protein OPV22_015316 [Ensete ventricosum]|uniref:Uncharacterized protein n=1 Tax=Ensete ventricosum TaxID=4639 RepID=A0AAV8R9L2_ENSVE|nr:hypothetical protein OPV22_015316 [Ensete ventricosum]RWW22003.1 hypothetical protein GW17_00013829 [Ensete ventricosum]RZR77494.1 hypothetical protein BHM03_00002606 [Ensete ventricosum]
MVEFSSVPHGLASDLTIVGLDQRPPLGSSPRQLHSGSRKFFWLSSVSCPGLSFPFESVVSSIDIGSKWMKVAVVNLKPGQSPISIAINEMSKWQLPALVAFHDGDSLVGE